jgi:ArsR family transcriptional regulator
MYRAVAALSAIAHESRLAIFKLLVAQGPEGLPAGRVGVAVGLPPPTLSFHLSQLSHAGLVRARRHGRQIVYTADYEQMAALLRYLTENCCQGSGGDCQPPASTEVTHVERTRRRTH